MNADIRNGFISGAGVDPEMLRTLIVILTVATFFAIGAWITVQLIDAYRNGQLKAPDVVWGCVKTGVLLGTVAVIVAVL